MHENFDFLADALVQARSKKGYSQRRLALYSGVSNTEISRIEKGYRKNPSPKILKKLASALNTEYSFLLKAAGYITSVNTEFNTGQVWEVKNGCPINCADQEKQLIEKYRSIDPTSKKRVEAMVAFEYGLQEKRTKTRLTPKTMPNEKWEDDELVEFPKTILKASAGTGNYLTDDGGLSTILLRQDEIPERADYCTQISGDSMEPMIEDGDYVFVYSIPAIENGEIGLFSYNNEGVCKKLVIDYNNNIVKLMSLNSAYDPIIVGEFDTLVTFGKVVGVKKHGNDYY